MISTAAGTRLSPAEVAEIHKIIQPEIEKRGYVMAKSSGKAEYFVHVRYPFDPIAVARLTFEKAQPTVPFLRESDTRLEGEQREFKKTIAEMVREPK